MRLEANTTYKVLGKLTPGAILSAAGRAYRYLGVGVPYKSKSGRMTTILRFQGKCQQCGERFEFEAAKSRFHPYAKCAAHRPDPWRKKRSKEQHRDG